MDPRTWAKCIKEFFLWSTYDQFEDFKVQVKVHNVKDVKEKAWVGKTSFKVSVQFRWSKWTTTGTQDMKWEHFQP